MYLVYMLLFFILGILGNIFFRKEKQKWIYVIGTGIVVVAILLTVNNVLLFPSDHITIRALNEKDAASGAVNITMQNIKDKNDNILNYKVINGKWLDTGGGQRWGGVSAIGLTDCITIRLQKGNNRSVFFHATRWGGKANISFNNLHEKTFSSYVDSDNGVKTISLPNTGGFSDFGILNFFVLLIEGVVLESIICLLCRDREKKVNFIINHQYECVSLCIAFIGFTIMIFFGNTRSTWLDDTATMGIASKSRTLVNVIETILKEESTTPPLYTISWHYFSKLIPVGAKALTLWARMLSIIANTIAFYFGAIVVRKGWNKYVGFIFEIFLITSSTLIVNSAFSVRSYGFIIFLSLFLLYVIIRRIEEGKDGRKITTLVYTVVILAICYTHYFGVLTCFGFLLYESYLFIKRKYTYKFILAYVISGILYLPWLITNYLITREQWGKAFWIPSPTLTSVISTFVWLCSNQKIVLLGLVIGVFVTLYYINETRQYINLNLALVINIMIEILIAFTYSKYIDPKFSVWTNRYFLNLLPYILILTSMGLVEVVSFFAEDRIKKMSILYLALACILLVNSNVIFRVKEDMELVCNQPYREAAEYLLNTPDANNSETLVLISTFFSTGWDYYLTHNGKFGLLKYRRNYKGDFDVSNIQNYKKIYLLDIHVPLDDDKRKVLERYFHKVDQDQESTVQTYIRNE